MRQAPHWDDFIFKGIVYLILLAVFCVTFLPFLNILAISLNDATDSVRGGISFWPRQFSLQSYETVLGDSQIWSALRVTIARTVVGVPLSLFTITMLAYVLSRKDIIGGKTLTFIFLFTMYFSGGLIPYYMVLKSLGLLDTFWVFIIPNLVNVFYMIIVRTFINELPHELEESAKIDGANDLQIFLKVYLPLCLPVLATVGMFLAIDQWNAWFDSYAFTSSMELKTLQAKLVQILNQADTSQMTSGANASIRQAISPQSIRMAITIIATLPILLVYPLVQRFFAEGMTLGSVKM
ncbi:sugar ABC transporter permease [Paenibacillus albidus]|uniref:Sugar ABC transporter permease n=1 Tax=Paenibacillus albidus TaxID=2041023 RepID=A0A917C4I8_9BACL|nr:carbohydrate ABC transporter permease [Paenibacillus albidus]GGF71655.1 sugar ABC transporter permease [Paenibacillus albidus]